MRALLLLLTAAILPASCGFAAPEQPSGIAGVITISPVRGGPIRIGAPNSRPLADTEFVVMSGEKEVASFTTGADGTFRVLLPPGQYSVRKKNHQTGIGRYGPFDAFVSAGEMTKVEWNCDSGMR